MHTFISHNRPAESFFDSGQETQRTSLDTMNVEVGWLDLQKRRMFKAPTIGIIVM